ncbi:MAG: family 10 glycosylhydrolase [Ruminococcus sp.]|nr:family 10 glycosylhydrolase [Ruminococcus sp.]
MRRFFWLLLTAASLLLSGCGKESELRILNRGTEALTTSSSKASDDSYTPLNYSEQKAVWISYIELADFLADKDEASLESEFLTAIENIKPTGFNTVYVHVRAFSDAYYSSSYFPKATILSGTSFDPLEIMIKIAHENDISFHAWINPFRCMSENDIKQVSDSYLVKQWYNEGTIVKSADDSTLYWMNPSYDEVFELICNGVSEVINNYDVDGIHFDDYFFPTTDEAFDKEGFESSGESDLSEYRMSRVNKLISEVYSTIKSLDENILFGLSPQGNIDNDYSTQYADVKLWCSEEGYCDYIVPQVYYGYESSCPYKETIDEWNDMCEASAVSLVIGLGEYKIITEDEFISTKGIIANMINDAKELSCYSGVAIYNYKNLFAPDEENAQRVSAEKELIEDSLK